ncbi:MAG: lamin tail domain-containing protein [Bacteroidetes bacterium]|nr:lamin tail domain-containing protein [Bacteroidota bacterium]
MKPTITKKIIALIYAIIISATGFAQTKNDSTERRKIVCDEIVKQSAYIFEGKLISIKDFKGQDNNHYTSALIEIQEVIKGNIQKGTIELITEDSYYEEEVTPSQNGNSNADVKSHTISIVHDASQVVYNGTALYFCSGTEKGTTTSGVINSNNKSLFVIDGVPFTNNIIHQEGIKGLRIGSHFKTMSDLYTFMKNNNAMNISNSVIEKKSLNVAIVKQQSISDERKSVNNDAIYNEKVKAYKESAEKRLAIIQKNNARVAECAELFISEYLCGQGNNKSIEIYNPTHNAINLANYSLLIYHGASYTPTTITLTGTISAQSAYVVSKPNANSAILAHTNQTSNNLNFNGDECIVLNKASVHIDKIGEIGIAIGSGGWALTPSGSTNNSDLRRQFNIGQGDTSWINCKSEWNIFTKDSISNLGQHQNVCGGLPDPNLLLTLANGQTTGTGSNRYFEYDVMVSSDVPTWYDYSAMHISHDITAFGSNIITSGNITITPYSAFNTPTYTVLSQDISSDSITMSFGTNLNNSSWTRTSINSTPQPMLHFKIKIQNCGAQTNIGFGDTTDLHYFSSYTINQTDNPNTNYVPYDYTYYTGGINQTLCQIKITDFTSPISAGIGNILTITGNGFGNSRGNGQVKFRNADNGGATSIPISNANDYLNWSDNQIQIRMPSFIDTVPSAPTYTTQYIVGGHDFTIINNAGDSTKSTINSNLDTFTVFYNIANIRNFTTKIKSRVNLTKLDVNGGYIFHLNPTDFPGGSVQRGIFIKAVKDWRCMTGANFIVGSDTVRPSPTAIDNVNYVSFSLGSTTALAKTSSHISSCSNGSVGQDEVDMQFINNSSIFVYDSTYTQNIPNGKYDFYEVCLHEIGHAIGLCHNVIKSDLMYWDEQTNISSTNRKQLISGFSPDSGASYNVIQSYYANLGTCWHTITLGSCQMSGIQKYQVGNYNLFPNPTTSTITIQGTSSLGTISVYNTIGQLIIQQTTKENNAEIDLSNQAAGFYLIKISNSFTKVIKQ